MTTIDLAQLETTDQVRLMVTDLVGAVLAAEGFSDRFAARGKPVRNDFSNRFAARSKPDPAQFSARFAARGKISPEPFGDRFAARGFGKPIFSKRFIARSKDVSTQTFYVGSF